MKRVADEHQRRRRAVDLALVRVEVAEQDELLEREEHQNPGEQRAEHWGRRKQRQRFGQEGQQRHTEQRADGVADQPRHETRAHANWKKHKGGGDEQAAAAAEKTQAERGREQMHGTFYWVQGPGFGP